MITVGTYGIILSELRRDEDIFRKHSPGSAMVWVWVVGGDGGR